MPNSTSDKAPEVNANGLQHRVTAAAESLEVLRQDTLELSVDDRLRLVVQLWKSLPVEHRSALLTLQMEDAARSENRPAEIFATSPKRPRTSALRKWLFDPSHTSDLYSAPRRFDLATIFVVTAAYSLLLGGLTAMGWPPSVKIGISILAAMIAATQAMFLGSANPRGVSVLTGMATCSLLFLVAYVVDSRRPPFLVLPIAMSFCGILGGIAGYLMGTCIGGIFLVADLLRGKFEKQRAEAGEDELTNDTDIQELNMAIRESRRGDA